MNHCSFVIDCRLPDGLLGKVLARKKHLPRPSPDRLIIWGKDISLRILATQKNFMIPEGTHDIRAPSHRYAVVTPSFTLVRPSLGGKPSFGARSLAPTRLSVFYETLGTGIPVSPQISKPWDRPSWSIILRTRRTCFPNYILICQRTFPWTQSRESITSTPAAHSCLSNSLCSIRKSRRFPRDPKAPAHA